MWKYRLGTDKYCCANCIQKHCAGWQLVMQTALPLSFKRQCQCSQPADSMLPPRWHKHLVTKYEVYYQHTTVTQQNLLHKNNWKWQQQQNIPHTDSHLQCRRSWRDRQSLWTCQLLPQRWTCCQSSSHVCHPADLHDLAGLNGQSQSHHLHTHIQFCLTGLFILQKSRLE